MLVLCSQKHQSKTLGIRQIKSNVCCFCGKHLTACIIAFVGCYTSLALYHDLFCMRRMWKMLSSSERQDQCLASGGAVILLLTQVILRLGCTFHLPATHTANLYILDTCVVFHNTNEQTDALKGNKLQNNNVSRDRAVCSSDF